MYASYQDKVPTKIEKWKDNVILSGKDNNGVWEFQQVENFDMELNAVYN